MENDSGERTAYERATALIRAMNDDVGPNLVLNGALQAAIIAIANDMDRGARAAIARATAPSTT